MGGSGATNSGYAFTCDECHADTVAMNSSSALNGLSAYNGKHVNGVKDVKFARYYGADNATATSPYTRGCTSR